MSVFTDLKIDEEFLLFLCYLHDDVDVLNPVGVEGPQAGPHVVRIGWILVHLMGRGGGGMNEMRERSEIRGRRKV